MTGREEMRRDFREAAEELPTAFRERAIAAADAAYDYACSNHMTFHNGLRFVVRAIAEAVAREKV